MEPRTPEDVDRLFAERMNAGDVEGVVALYEPGARFVSADGAAEGADAIRARIRAIVETEFFVTCNVVAVHRAGNTAVLYNDWQGTSRGPCGDRLGSAGKALEVVRQQPDGSWRFIIDDPNGRS